MTNKYPKLRSHIRKRKDGSVRVYYVYDMRSSGEPDKPLGHDYDEALKAWDEIHNNRPRIAGTLEEAFKRWESEKLPEYTNAGTKKGYRTSLKWLRAKFGPATWDAIKLHHLTTYLEKRTAKTQANREMALLSVIWNWARTRGITELHWPAAGMEKSRWKNREQARRFEVTDALFTAVYECADQVLKDAMDLATATGMRLTDCRTILLSSSGQSLALSASKTGKNATFDVASSPVLTRLVARRRALRASHLMLLSTPTGRPVSATMLRDRYDAAREKAASRPENAAIADQIRAMYLRDCRKRAADLAEDDEAASKLLQHSSVALTGKHYRTRATKLKPVR